MSLITEAFWKLGKKAVTRRMVVCVEKQTGEVDNLKKLHYYLNAILYPESSSHTGFDVRQNLGYQLLGGHGSLKLACYPSTYYATITF